MTRASTLATFSLGLSLSTALLASPALAQSARDQALAVTKATIELSGGKVTWGRVEGDDARFTVSGTTIVKSGDNSSNVAIQTLTFVGAKTTADGGFTADEIDLDKVEVVEKDGRFTLDRGVMKRVTAKPAEVVQKSKGFADIVESFEATGLVLVDDKNKTVPIAAVKMDTSEWVDGVPRKGSFEVRGITVPVDPKDEEMKDLVALGYGSISVDIAGSGSWDEKTGRLVLNQTTSGANMGGLDIGLTIGGLTPDVIAKFRLAGDDSAKQMELMQGLTLEKARLRWVDASLTTRVIAQQAKEQGADAATFTKQLKLMVPMMTSMIGNKGFEAKVNTAVGAYLDQPKSLTVSANPAQPLPVSQIMGAAMMAPQSLPTVLGADVAAND